MKCISNFRGGERKKNKSGVIKGNERQRRSEREREVERKEEKKTERKREERDLISLGKI